MQSSARSWNSSISIHRVAFPAQLLFCVCVYKPLELKEDLWLMTELTNGFESTSGEQQRFKVLIWARAHGRSMGSCHLTIKVSLEAFIIIIVVVEAGRPASEGWANWAHRASDVHFNSQSYIFFPSRYFRRVINNRSGFGAEELIKV